MKTRILLAGALAMLLQHCTPTAQTTAEEKLIQYVNPFIGVAREGNQSPGPRYPFGMIHLSPINVSGFSPSSYVADKNELYGIGLINLVGTGCANFGNILLLPSTSKPSFSNESLKILSDTATPGWYACKLDNNIAVEMTDLSRSGIVKIDFGTNKNRYLKIDLSRINSEDTIFSLRKQGNTLSGSRHDGQFCGKPGNTRVYFHLTIPELSPDALTLVHNGSEVPEKELIVNREPIGAIIDLSQLNNPVEIRLGISFVSEANAKLNLETELAKKTFDAVMAENQEAWEKMLGKIQVEGGTHSDRVKFYTAIYHTMSHPNILNDVNGEYPAMESFKTTKKQSGNRYTLFSLWDTYRNLHPFMCLVYPAQQSEMVKSMLDMYTEYGWLPHWECFSREKGVMNGDPACIVINDTYQRGIQDFDTEKAFKAMINNAKVVYYSNEHDRKNVEYIRKAIKPYWQYNGYIPAEYKAKGGDVWGTVATTLEYNLADWNIALMAKSLGKTDDYNTFLALSKGWQNLFDPATGFIRQRSADGTWTEPFNADERSGEMSWPYSGGPGYTEGNAHHYNFFVPHDIPRLIELMGGPEKFTSRLQLIFDSSRYEPTNEPDIAYPFLFNYVAGQEWRTQKIVRQLVEKEYTTGKDGIPGNDDTGTMSAWLIFAMMGIYPDCPGSTDYQLCAPVFDKITIHLDGNYYKGKEFIIETRNNSKENVYIKSVTLNRQKHEKYQISHLDLVNGGYLLIELTDKKPM